MSELRLVELKRGGIVYCEGFPAESVHVVCRGSVSLASVDETGTERITRVIRSGELFGLDTFLPQATRFFMAVAREECEICFMLRRDFERLIRQDNDRLWKLVCTLNLLHHESEKEKLDISGHTVAIRLVRLISKLAPKLRNPTINSDCSDLNLTQKELAQILGVPQETVSRELKRLRDKKASKLTQGDCGLGARDRR